MRKTIALHKEGSNKHSNDDKVTEGIIQNIVDNHSDGHHHHNLYHIDSHNQSLICYQQRLYHHHLTYLH